MYIAVTYIGGRYLPGEAVTDLTGAELEWLLRTGAVRKAAPAPDMPEGLAIDAFPGEAPPEAVEDDGDGIDEDDEVPEIDAMAGIVKAEPAPKPAPKPRGTARKAPKGGKAR